MGELVVVLALVAAVAGAQWLAWDLRTVPVGTADAGPDRAVVPVSVVVPARDEARTLPALLESLGRLSVAPAEVLVVDDDSQDATAAVARAAGAEVVASGGPPPGWTGKAWACHVGARDSSGDLLLFLDADTVLAPDALSALLAVHGQHGGLVSVHPFHDAVRPHEQLSAYPNVVSVLASAAFARRPGTPPMAFGPCLLTSRADYDRAGGHAAVRAAVLDDVALAVAYDRAGLAVRSALGGGAVRMRSYPDGLGQLAAGWTKNVAAGASATTPRALVATAGWVSAHHAVAVGAVLAVGEALTGSAEHLAWGHPAVWLAAWVVLAGQLRSLLRRIGSFRWWTWALFPVPLLAFDVLFARSALLTVVRRSVQWRGRPVDLPGRGGGGPA